VAWCGWHLPALYDGALRYPAACAAEVVTYLGLGVAFWLRLIGSRPLSPALAPPRRAALLTGTVIVTTLLGMVLVFGCGLAYPGYAGPGHHVLSVVYDQQARPLEEQASAEAQEAWSAWTDGCGRPRPPRRQIPPRRPGRRCPRPWTPIRSRVLSRRRTRAR